MSNAKRIFASVTCLAVLGATSDALATAPPQIMRPGPDRPCCSGDQAQVTGWMKFTTGSHTPNACSDVYFKFVSANGVQYGRGYGNAASGKCYYKFVMHAMKGSPTGVIYSKILDAHGLGTMKWEAGGPVHIAPGQHKTQTIKYEPPQE